MVFSLSTTLKTLRKKNPFNMSTPNPKINFAFWGTPDVAEKTLEILKQAGYLPSIVITSPDARSGRKMLLTAPLVKTWAILNNIPYLQPEKLDEEFAQKISVLSLDLSIVVAYGKIIPEKIIFSPKLGSVNIHYSLLPKYRGASPVESTILNNEKETGVTIQQMEFKLDAGAILAQEKTEIQPDEKTPELKDRLISIGGNLLTQILPNLIADKIKPLPQDESLSTHCKKIKKEDGLIDLGGDALTNYNKFRAYATWPRTYFFQEEKRLIITSAKLENNQFIIEKVIPEGGKEVVYRRN